MNKILKSILQKDSIVFSPPIIYPSPFKISNGQIVYNNNCETYWTGSFNIPTGFTATVEGEKLLGTFGNQTPFGYDNYDVYLGFTYNVVPGNYLWLVSLGNSGVSNNASTYKMTITLNNGDELTRTLSRTLFESGLWDQQPCFLEL